MLIINEEIILITFTIFAASFFASVKTIPIINKIGLRFNIVDIPNLRKVHKGEKVRLGGLGILIGFIFGLTIFFSIGKSYLNINLGNSEISILIVGSFTFLLLGLLDDLFALSPFTRLGIQFFITSLLFAFGLNIDAIDLSWINNNIDPIILNSTFKYVFISFWVVGLTNAINWLDGLDELASGVVFIQAIGISIIFIALGKLELVLIVASFCGGILGFLKHNRYPAKIMMGDCGSYFLGSFLSISSLIGLSQNTNIQSSTFIDIFPLHLAFLIFILPLVDMSYVISSRIIKGYSPFYPDNSHFHHKLLNNGFSQRKTVKALYIISIISVFFSVLTFCITR